MSVSPARKAALRALARVRTRAGYASETLDAVVSSSRLSSQDVALATRLTYGTLQTVGVLDWVIDRYATRPGAIEPQVRDALRVATYEILYLSTPAWAAVDEGVEAVRRARPQAATLANAILRRVADQAASFPWGDPSADDEALARATGHPGWMADLFVQDLGREAARAVMESANEPAPLYLWRNPFVASLPEAMAALEQDGARPFECGPAGCIVAGEPAAAVRGQAVARSLALVSDAAAQLVAPALDAHPGRRLVDIGAGRGTKTVQMQASAVARGGPAAVWAVDLHAFKTRVLAQRLADLHVPQVTVLEGDATHVASIVGLPEAGTADGVLVDAPCSGLGTLRRHPDKRWRLSPHEIEPLARLQATLLREAASLVRPGGLVVYSTCSLARRENHDVVSGFLGEGSGSVFRTRSLAHVVPPPWTGWVGPEGWFQSLPLAGGPDGHFIAALERTG